MVVIEAKPYKRIHVSIDLSEDEAHAFQDSIYEATSLIDNWRSDPSFLYSLKAALVDARQRTV